MEILITRAIETLIFPPGNILFCVLFGLVLLRIRPALGKLFIGGGLVMGYLLSTPFVSGALISILQHHPGLTGEDLKNTQAKAIVVLASGYYYDAPEYGNVDTVGGGTLLRIRYGAYLHRATGLPILVSGGNPLEKDRPSLAQVMADSLKNDFAINEELIWLEDKSTTTAENAKFSQQYLADKGIDTVLLVTQAWHMPRSVGIFEQTGMKVVPAPTVFEARKVGDGNVLDLLPNSGSLLLTQLALHELLGRVWYAIRH